MQQARALQVGSSLFLVLAVGLIGYAVVFTAWVFVDGTLELGIDEETVGVTREEIAAFDRSLADYLDHLHVALGGFMFGLGVSAAGLSWYGIRGGHRWALWVLLAALMASVLIGLPLHYLHGFTSALHLGPLYVGVILAIAGAWLSHRGLSVFPGHGKA